MDGIDVSDARKNNLVWEFSISDNIGYCRKEHVCSCYTRPESGVKSGPMSKFVGFYSLRLVYLCHLHPLDGTDPVYESENLLQVFSIGDNIGLCCKDVFDKRDT